MSGDPFREYTARLAAELWRRWVAPGRVVTEVREHLADIREERIRAGATAADAGREAMARMGAPAELAAALAAARPSALDRALVGACAATAAATALLTLSLLILRPPRANLSMWLAIAAALLVQTAATIALVGASARGRLLRTAVGAGGALFVLAGGSWVAATLSSPHFEGYAPVLGSLAAAQGVLTVARALRRGAALRPTGGALP
jgi:hypothetical protein